jgi:predicted dehydrogenase
MSQIRLGIIGAGNFVYKRHIPEILESRKVKLVSLCRRDIKQLKKIGKYSGFSSLYINHQFNLDYLL